MFTSNSGLLDGAPDYSSAVIRNFLLTKGLVDETGKALDPMGIYVYARQYEVSANELDAAMGWNGGAAAAWVSENGLLSLDGFSNYPTAPIILTPGSGTPNNGPSLVAPPPQPPVISPVSPHRTTIAPDPPVPLSPLSPAPHSPIPLSSPLFRPSSETRLMESITSNNPNTIVAPPENNTIAAPPENNTKAVLLAILAVLFTLKA